MADLDKKQEQSDCELLWNSGQEFGFHNLSNGMIGLVSGRQYLEQ